MFNEMSSVTSSSSSLSRKTVSLSPEEKDLWELCHYAGVTIDPAFTKIILDLLKMNVHPKAICQVLNEMIPNSKYFKKYASKNQDTSKTSASSKASAPDDSSKGRLSRASSLTSTRSLDSVPGTETDKLIDHSVQARRTKSPTEVHSDGGNSTSRSTKSGAMSDGSTSHRSVTKSEQMRKNLIGGTKSSSLLNLPSQTERSKSTSSSVSSSLSSNATKKSSRPLVPRTQRAKSAVMPSK